jgi:hypothetical protein
MEDIAEIDTRTGAIPTMRNDDELEINLNYQLEISKDLQENIKHIASDLKKIVGRHDEYTDSHLFTDTTWGEFTKDDKDEIHDEEDDYMLNVKLAKTPPAKAFQTYYSRVKGKDEDAVSCQAPRYIKTSTILEYLNTSHENLRAPKLGKAVPGAGGTGGRMKNITPRNS